MKNHILTVALCALGMFAAGCDDFLEELPQSSAASANFYKNDNDVKNAVNACYANLQKSQLYGEFMINMAETRSDNIEDQNPGGNAGRDYNIDKFTAGADNAAITAVWQYSYNTIMRCNAVIQNIGACSVESNKIQYEAEARFLRALMYFNIVRFWGDAPLVLTQITSEQSVNARRDEASKIYDAIVDDLNFAATNLPKSYDKTEMGRATSGAALALLGKVYLTQQKWADCKTTLQRLMSSEFDGVYELLPDVAEVFKMENKLNKEMVFVVHYSKVVVGEGHNFSQYYKNASLLDRALRTAYEDNDARKGLLETISIDKDNTPFVKFYDTFDLTTKNVGYDQPVIRYADVLLMYAEALNEISFDASESSEALKYLNQVRTRSGATAYKAADLNSKDKFREQLMEERRLEFPLECHRWFDLIRTNTAEAAMAKVGLNITKNDYLYPIPKYEMELCPNLTQNPGYSDK